jgi:hypothetical protein
VVEVSWGGCRIFCDNDDPVTLPSGVSIVPLEDEDLLVEDGDTLPFTCPAGYTAESGAVDTLQAGVLLCKNGDWTVSWGDCIANCPAGSTLDVGDWSVETDRSLGNLESYRFTCTTPGYTGAGDLVCRDSALAFSPDEGVGWGGCYKSCEAGQRFEQGAPASSEEYQHGERGYFECQGSYEGLGEMVCNDGALVVDCSNPDFNGKCGCEVGVISNSLIIAVGVVVCLILTFALVSHIALKIYRGEDILAGCRRKSDGLASPGNNPHRLSRKNSLLAVQDAFNDPNIHPDEAKRRLASWRSQYDKIAQLSDRGNIEEFYLELAKAVVDLLQIDASDMQYRRREILTERITNLVEEMIQPKKRKDVDVEFLRKVMLKFVLQAPEAEDRIMLAMEEQRPSRKRSVRFEDEEPEFHALMPSGSSVDLVVAVTEAELSSPKTPTPRVEMLGRSATIDSDMIVRGFSEDSPKYDRQSSWTSTPPGATAPIGRQRGTGATGLGRTAHRSHSAESNGSQSLHGDDETLRTQNSQPKKKGLMRRG